MIALAQVLAEFHHDGITWPEAFFGAICAICITALLLRFL